MKSKIRVEYDFDKKEPYLQLYLERDSEGNVDLRDSMLKNFIETASIQGMCVMYPQSNRDNSVAQIRLGGIPESLDDLWERNYVEKSLDPSITYSI